MLELNYISVGMGHFETNLSKPVYTNVCHYING